MGKTRLTHVVAYELLVGPVPEGLELDHTCRTRRCCNPAHLDPVTHQVNQRRGNSPAGINARKTCCPKGHSYDEANTYYSPRGWRLCRTCQREHEQGRPPRKRKRRERA